MDRGGEGPLTSLKRLERQLLQRFQPLISHLLHLPRKHRLRRRRTINTIRLDTHQRRPVHFQIQMRVERHNARLIRLRHVREDDIHHGHEHAVAQRVSRVFDDRDHVRAVRRHVDQVAARAVRELDGEDGAFGPDDVGDVAD